MVGETVGGGCYPKEGAGLGPLALLGAPIIGLLVREVVVLPRLPSADPLRDDFKNPSN